MSAQVVSIETRQPAMDSKSLAAKVRAGLGQYQEPFYIIGPNVNGHVEGRRDVGLDQASYELAFWMMTHGTYMVSRALERCVRPAPAGYRGTEVNVC